MNYLPANAINTIFSFLHKEYDYEKNKVMQELEYKCEMVDRRHGDLITSQMLPIKCYYCRQPSPYRYISKEPIKCSACGRVEYFKYCNAYRSYVM